jgi:hypothetical protein
VEFDHDDDGSHEIDDSKVPPPHEWRAEFDVAATAQPPALATAIRWIAPVDLGAPMAIHVRRIDYFSTTVRDDPGEAYKLLATLANLGVNLLAFTAVPIGPLHTQLTIFPEDSAKLANEAKMDRLVLDGPHPALLVQGDDELGALAELHMKLMKANVNVYAATGVADGGGSFGYVIYVRPEQYSLAVAALGL